MKIQAIRPYVGNDGSDKYEITFTDDKRPLIMSTQPEFDGGHTIPRDQLEIRTSQRGQFFVLKTETRPESREKDNSIRGQTAIKIITEIYCAGLLEDFETSEDPYVTNLREWVNSALIKDPVLGEVLKGGKICGKRQ